MKKFTRTAMLFVMMGTIAGVVLSAGAGPGSSGAGQVATRIQKADRSETLMALVEPAAGGATAPIAQTETEHQPEYAVQAVLSPKQQAVIASGIDAKLNKITVDDGDKFKKGDLLIEYDCAVDHARLKEVQSRQRVTQKQLEAFEKLRAMESASDIEFLVARENNEQNKALADQIRGRLKSCRQTAPFDGRVMSRMASQYEFVQTGRVLMSVSSSDPLRAEFLIPSKWLRWLNIGTPLAIHIGETDKKYDAKIVAIHGEVDPVSQSVQVVAEMEDYHEELLPGMSGQAVFDPLIAEKGPEGGFLGLLLNSVGMDGDGERTE